jgi:Tol biopolymer transport system component
MESKIRERGKRMKRDVLTIGSLTASLFLVIAAFALTPAPTFAAEPCPNAARRAEQPFGQELPDCRAYELVSPVPSKADGQDAVEPNAKNRARAALSGEAFTFTSSGDLEGSEGGVIENQLLSRRGPDGWSTQSITPPYEPAQTEVGSENAYEATAFTPELTEGLAASTKAMDGGLPTPLEGGKREWDLYLTDFAPGAYQYLGQSQQPVDATSDLTHVVMGEHGGLSESIDGHSYTVGMENDGALMSASAGAPTVSFLKQKDTWHAASSEGSRVYFTSPAEAGEENQLYVRINAEQPQSPMDGETCADAVDACTIEVSASQRSTPDPNGLKMARYWGASVSGALVYFTSKAELTNDAYTDEDSAANLYQYNLENGQLTDLTVDTEEATGGAAVKGVVQMSEDGSYVYYVALGALQGPHDEALRNVEGAEPVAGEDNMYLYHDGETRFVATLTSGDRSDWDPVFANASVSAGPAVNSAVMSASGEYLVFVSEASLTGYDNVQRQPGDCEGRVVPETDLPGTENCREVFLYDATNRVLTCVSCNPSGEQPSGPSGLRQLTTRGFTEYVPRNVLDDGTVFFDSADDLVPEASEARENVYEYENGHVYPLSDVTGAYESFFLDASANGNDVFFATANDLIPKLTGGGDNISIYDARVDGGFPPLLVSSGCSGVESCKPPESAQPNWSEASAVLSGSGNLPPAPVATSKPVVLAKKTVKCPKEKRLSRGKCVKQKRKTTVRKAKKSSEGKRRVSR